MNSTNCNYLKFSLNLLEDWLPGNQKTMMKWLKKHPDDTDLEEDQNHLVYCQFSYPVLNQQGIFCKDPLFFEEGLLERIMILVYANDQIIADCSAFHGSMNNVLARKEIIDFLNKESDWMYLEHYTLCGTFFSDGKLSENGEALLFSNAYVTTSYRQKGIFTQMLQMMRDFSLRHNEGNTILYSVLSLDPDIACYGPDSSDQPYIYSMEQDEPKRVMNARIMKKLGYLPIRLEETEPSENDDGTKLWFAVRKEEDQIIETARQFQA